jgi:hypothetical protein
VRVWRVRAVCIPFTASTTGVNMREQVRLQQLTEEIDAYFDLRDPWVIPRFEPHVEKHVMDMFEVRGIEKNMVEFKHLFNDRLYRAVIGEMKIAHLVRIGDVFLMALIKRPGTAWRVWHMSPPYESCDTEEAVEPSA